jgi:hypothetical protein
MTSKEASQGTPLLDHWLLEVGEAGVVAAVEAARLGIAEGRLPGFSDRDELDEYLRRPRRRTA